MRRPSTRATLLGVLVVSLLLAGVVSFYAASSPDGLSKVSIDHGFADSETDHATGESPFAGYGTSFVGSERLGTGMAGVVGVLVCVALGSGLALVLRRRRPEGDGDTTATSHEDDDATRPAGRR